MSKSERQRDRTITREIHRLFWIAQTRDRFNLIFSYVARMTAVAAYNIFIPLVTAYALQAIIDGDAAKVQYYAWLIIGLALVYCVCWAVGDIAVSKNGINASKYVQQRLFDNLMGKDYAFYGNAYFGSLGAQMFRLREAFHRYALMFTNEIPKQIVIVGAGIGVIAWQSVPLALVTLVMMIVVLSYTLLTNQYRMKFRRQEAAASSVVAGEVGDALTHGVTVKSFASEQYESERLQTSLATWGQARYRSWVSFWPADTGRMALTAIATAVLLVFSASAYQNGSITITIVVLIQLYVIKLVTSTMDIATIVKMYEDTMSAAYEPIKTMLVPTEVNDPEQPKTLPKPKGKGYTLGMNNIAFRYPEAHVGQSAISELALTIVPGEKIGIVGYSGSGKTTLTKLLMRFMDVTEGSITVNDVDIRDLRQRELRRLISYVPQEPLLFHRSILENIAYGKPSATKDEVIAAAKAAYVDEFVKELPEGYDTLVGERGVKLSGGQRQRVAIARAILRDAPILVLDEATSALDSRSEQYIQKALWKLMKGRTALVIAHRLSTIQRMDRIAVMDKGKIVQLGSHEELLRDGKGIYAELWAHQSGGYVGVPKSSAGTEVAVT